MFHYADGIAAQDQWTETPPCVDIEGPRFLTGAPGELLERAKLRAAFEPVFGQACEPMGDLTFVPRDRDGIPDRFNHGA